MEFEKIDAKLDKLLRDNNLPDTVTLASEEIITKFSASCSKKSYYKIEVSLKAFYTNTLYKDMKPAFMIKGL
jgi:hypothetical protein